MRDGHRPHGASAGSGQPPRQGSSGSRPVADAKLDRIITLLERIDMRLELIELRVRRTLAE